VLEEAERRKEVKGVFEKILTYEDDAAQGVNKDEVVNYEVGHRRQHQPKMTHEKLMPELFDWADEDSNGHLTEAELTCIFEPAFCPNRDSSFRIWAVRWP
jgi:hypothetical protein